LAVVGIRLAASAGCSREAAKSCTPVYRFAAIMAARR
jgi:hypothetical protein